MPKSTPHQVVTETIKNLISTDTRTFQWPWVTGKPLHRPTNASTGVRYTGINIFALWAAALSQNYSSGYWATYKTWSAIGCQVRKGERGTAAIYYGSAEDKDDPDNSYRFARTFRLFNAGQVDGWSEAHTSAKGASPLASAEAFFSNLDAKVETSPDGRAYYSPRTDTVYLPDASLFRDTEAGSADEAYVATKAHEIIHWTGASHRLDRLADYHTIDGRAFEELIAELGAALLCSDLSVSPQPRPDHAEYIRSWLQHLSDNPHAFCTAATKASQAISYLDDIAAPPIAT